MQNQRIDSKQQSAGFTLVELMITLSIAAVLVTIGIPSFMGTIARSRVTAASNEMVVTLNVAKSEAIRSGRNTILCKSSNGSSCNSSGNWSDGWLLFDDTDGDQSLGTTEQIIRVHEATDPSLSFIYRTGNYIEFRPNGQINETGRFCFRNSYQDSDSRAVIITPSGRFRTEQRTGSNDDCSSA